VQQTTEDHERASGRSVPKDGERRVPRHAPDENAAAV
jgi:hypothetical protein